MAAGRLVPADLSLLGSHMNAWWTPDSSAHPCAVQRQRNGNSGNMLRRCTASTARSSRGFAHDPVSGETLHRVVLPGVADPDDQVERELT
jgi:hypothetical protein